MFEHTEFGFAMTVLAIAGIALMADEKIETTCINVVKWVKKRGRA
ncbi:MAG: hypothetical protein U0361_24590 [Nitrospiraceae bacterium]